MEGDLRNQSLVEPPRATRLPTTGEGRIVVDSAEVANDVVSPNLARPNIDMPRCPTDVS